MQLRIFHILCSGKGALKKVHELTSDAESVVETWERQNKDTISHYILVTGQEQDLLDSLQEIADSEDSIRLIVQPVDASLPENYEIEEEEEEENKVSFFNVISRAEMLDTVKKQAQFNGSFLILVLLSSIVAAIALIQGNVAILIGAMVLTPLLGPNLALAFATATSDTRLAKRAVLCGIAGFGLTFATTLLTGLLLGATAAENMLPMLVEFGFESIIVAVCAGVAATILLLQGTLSSLIGVMVAVAFLPPVAMSGLSLGAGDNYNAINSMLLFAINLASFNLASKSVLLLAGIRPHRKDKDQNFSRNIAVYLLGWLIALLLLSAGIYFKN